MAVKEVINPSKRNILVTTEYQMYKAKQLFAIQGFEVIPYKADYKAGGKNKITIMDFQPSTNNLELIKKGIKEIIGR